jgi:transposase
MTPFTHEALRMQRERRFERRRFLEQRVRALHAEGLPTRAIATRLQVSQSAVVDTMQRLGLPRSGRVYP